MKVLSNRGKNYYRLNYVSINIFRKVQLYSSAMFNVLTYSSVIHSNIATSVYQAHYKHLNNL